MNLILDLDGTLIDDYYDDANNLCIRPRPHLTEFLIFAFDHFDSVSIWTNGSLEWYRYVYKQELYKHIPFIYCFNMVITFDDGLVMCKESSPKSLRKIYKIYPEFNKNNTILIDDSPHTMRADLDNELVLLIDKLKLRLK